MFVPSREAVSSLLTLVQYTPEAAHHLEKKFNMIISIQKLTEFKDFSDALRQFVLDVEKQCSTARNLYAGQRFLSPAAQLVPEVPVPPPASISGGDDQALTFELIKMPEGRFDRDYKVSDGNYASQETYEYLDALFQKWMAENHMRRQDGVMYLVDENEALTALSFEELQQRVENPESGFSRYVSAESNNRYAIRKFALKEEVSREATPPAGPHSDQVEPD